jgi:hypothetical protein
MVKSLCFVVITDIHKLMLQVISASGEPESWRNKGCYDYAWPVVRKRLYYYYRQSEELT